MSRTQQLEQQPEQQQGQVPATGRDQETFGLPRPLYTQIMQLSPDDAEALSSMLTAHPGLSGPILQVAAGHMGNAAVQRAISITKAGSTTGPGEQPTHGPLSQAEMHEFLDDAPAKAPASKHPLSQAEMHEFLDDAPAKAPANKHPLSQAEMHEFLDDAPAKAPANKHPLSQAEMHQFLDDSPARAQPAESAAAPRPARAIAEPAWVAGARAYNATHSEWVDEFNELTVDVCRLDGEAKVDPQAVARWQSHHGLAADGKIGPHTVGAARKLKAKAPEVAAAPQADARPPV